MSVSDSAVALSEYEKAYKLGKKEGQSLPVLDHILKEKKIQTPKEVSLGLVQVQMNQIVGTKTEGRTNAFSRGFYPIIKSPSEFTTKWVNLYNAHINEGIRDPIKAYEFMNQFYVEEGNKRVSVLKYCDAVSIPAQVTRIIPPWTEDKETKIYYEFMDFYELSKVNYISLSQEGGFASIQQLVGKRPDEMWNDDEQITFRSIYNRFEMEYHTLGGSKIPIQIGDAFLFFLKLYGYDAANQMTTAQLKETIAKTMKEFKLLEHDTALELQMEPASTTDVKKNILTRLLPSSSPQLKVAFIHEKSKENSSWTYAHELGRMHLEETFADEIRTINYEGTTVENADDVLEEAINAGNNLIFTTTPTLHKASLKAALNHPNVKILNCSLNNAQKNMRTYYARMYEAKFLMGAIAGSMSVSGNIGYVADYPIYGMTANINAFALGAKMVNPRAKIILEWSTLKDHDMYQNFANHQVGVISGLDMPIPGTSSRRFGLYRQNTETGNITNLAMPVWHWGKFYEKLIRNIMSGSWKTDELNDQTKGLNYWWGMSAEIIDVIYSQHLPIGTARLADLLKKNICEYNYNPFTGILYSQDGIVQNSVDQNLSPAQIVKMDWLAENVIGYIPKMEDLADQAKPVVQIQGLQSTDTTQGASKK